VVVFLLNNKLFTDMKLKIIIQVVLGIATIILAYLLFESIMKPQRFETLRSQRETLVIERLKDIRTAQIAFRNAHGRFISTLDSLVMFLEHGQLPTVRRTGEIPEEMTEAEALRLRIIRRDTVFTDAYFELFPPDTLRERHLTTPEEVQQFRQAQKETHLANLRFIPFTNRTKEFTIETGFLRRNNIEVPVIEVSAPLNTYMSEPEYHQLVVNAMKRAVDMNRFPGRRFGSMTDPITEGNWE
jgi:hypothetical protein